MVAESDEALDASDEAPLREAARDPAPRLAPRTQIGRYALGELLELRVLRIDRDLAWDDLARVFSARTLRPMPPPSRAEAPACASASSS
jgi:hypothetical protein